MEKAENLKSILVRQKAILSEFEGELAAIEGSDLAKTMLMILMSYGLR